MHMGESKQQPRALPGGNNGPHTAPTRAPDFITGLSIPPPTATTTPPTPPPAWELWDLGQAAAADRSSLTQRTRRTCEHWDALTPPPSAYLHWPLRRPLLLLGGAVGVGGAVAGGGGARTLRLAAGESREKEEKLHGSRFLLVLQFV